MLPLATYNALYAQGIWTFYTLFLAFGILPLMEIFYSGTTDTFTKTEEEKEEALHIGMFENQAFTVDGLNFY
jgi:hypothetical protein